MPPKRNRNKKKGENQEGQAPASDDQQGGSNPPPQQQAPSQTVQQQNPQEEQGKEPQEQQTTQKNKKKGPKQNPKQTPPQESQPKQHIDEAKQGHGGPQGQQQMPQQGGRGGQQGQHQMPPQGAQGRQQGQQQIPQQGAWGRPQGQQQMPQQGAWGRQQGQQQMPHQGIPGGPQGQQQMPQQGIPGGPQGQQQMPQQGIPGGPQGQQQMPQQGIPGGPQGQQRMPQQGKPAGPQGQQQMPHQGIPGGPQGQQQMPKQRKPGRPQGQQQMPQQQKPGGPQGQQQMPQQGVPGGPQGQQRMSQQGKPAGPQGQQQMPQQGKPAGPQGDKALTTKETSPAPTATVMAATKNALSQQMALKYIEMIPKRRDMNKCGTKGRKITVETNMFSILFGKNFCTKAIHYDVTIDPDKPKFMMRPVFEALRKKCYPTRHPAFDGRKNAYSANTLPFGEKIHEKVTVFNEEKMKSEEFSISLKKVNEIDLSWLKALKPGFTGTEAMLTGVQALDVIMHHGPSSSLIPVGRSLYYPPEGKPVYFQNAMQLWYGTFISAIAGWKPFLNIDVCHKAFPTAQSVVDTMKELCNIPFNSPITFQDVSRNSSTLSKYLKGLKVQHEIPGKPNTKRTHRILGLVQTPAKLDKFTAGDGKEYTVVQYFKEQHGYSIVFPDLPCLWVGSLNKKNHIPVELCKILGGQVVQRKMDPAQTSQMIREAATNTEKRKQKIFQAFNAVRLNECPTIRDEFGMAVDAKLTVVDARVLQPPSLQYDKKVEPRKGTWWPGKFASAACLNDNCWTFLNLDDRTRESKLYEFEQSLQTHAPKLAMKIGKALTPFLSVSFRQRDAKKNIVNAFHDYKRKNLQLVIVILPFGSEDAYPMVKQCSELGVSVLTQCIKCETLRKLSESTLGNILQKLNAKLNGINHSFVPEMRPACLSTPCILIGADVTHPSPDATDIPSIAAVVASHDSKAFQYNVQVRLQPPRLEIIQDLENIIVEQIKFFKMKTNHLPRTLIFYRDGVSEGQFPQVMHYEIGAMKRAFKRIQEGYSAFITFLVVQKRHHTRLFPTNPKNSDDRNCNVQAGTIVDTLITHPSHIDFYLVSHASIQGVARPTKYRCLLNEACLSEDDIEELTYYLCHMFARCTRSVSLPAPTYYAHLAAFRGRAYIHAQNICMSKLEEEQKSKLMIRLLHDNPMFFV